MRGTHPGRCWCWAPAFGVPAFAALAFAAPVLGALVFAAPALGTLVFAASVFDCAAAWDPRDARGALTRRMFSGVLGSKCPPSAFVESADAAWRPPGGRWRAVVADIVVRTLSAL